MLLNLFSGDDFKLSLITLLLRIPAVVLALSLHEAAHGFVAYKLGDPTARNLGRITINPLKHLDPIGAIAMLVFGIGWAKPVPINTRYFKKPKRDMALSSAAGPLCNLLQGLIGTVLLFVFVRLEMSKLVISGLESEYVGSFCWWLVEYGETGQKVVGILLFMLYIYAIINFSLFLFNLIPIPPFDGSRLAFALLPDKYYFGIMKYEQYIMIILLIIFWFGGNILGTVFGAFTDFIFSLFGWILP